MSVRITKEHCNKCDGITNNEIIGEHNDIGAAEDAEFRWNNTYYMLKCRGCESIQLKIDEWDSDTGDSERSYPPPMFRKTPAWTTDFLLALNFDSWNLSTLLNEVYVAIHNNLPALAAMGVRALLEGIMISKAGDHGSFEANLSEFEKAGFVSKVQRERLAQILEVGHAAIHRGHIPAKSDVIILVDIAESIIQSVFLQDEAVKKATKGVPPRPPRMKRVKTS